MNDAIKSPTKAIRAKCIDCCGGHLMEVSKCDITACPLHAFRMGKNPYRAKREYTDEQRAVMRERLLKNRA